MNRSFKHTRANTRRVSRCVSAALCLLLAVVCLLPLAGCSRTADKNTTPVVDGIDTVKLVPSADGHTEDQLTVKISLTDEFRSAAAKTDRIYLFELPSYIDAPTAGQTLKAGDFLAISGIEPKKVKKSLEFSLPLFDGGRTRLFSRFVIVKGPEVSKKNPIPASDITYTVIDVAAIGNAQDYTQSGTLSVKGQPSKKGLQVSADTLPLDVQTLAPSHVILDVPMQNLFLKAYSADAVHYVHNGTSRYLRRSALEALDEQIKTYSASGTTVYLRFTLGAPQPDVSPDLPDGLYVSTLLDDKKQYAVNMDNESIAHLMEGFFAFMADRYTSPNKTYGTAARFIVGSGANSQTNWSTGTSTDKVADYERLLRVADTALRSRCPDGRVYASFDSNWNRSAGEAEVFLANLEATASSYGDYPWQIAMELSAASSTLWRDDTTQDETATHLSVNNLLLLERTLKTPRYQYLGSETRRVLLTGLDIPSSNSNQQAASLVYAYCKALESDVCEALFYSSSLVSQPTTLLQNVFKIVDTTQNKQAIDLAIGQIGSNTAFDNLYQSVKAALPSVTMTSGEIKSTTGVSLRRGCDELCVFNDLGGLCGFESAGRIDKMELFVDQSLGYSKLYVQTEPTAARAGITVRLDAKDLMGVKELSAPIHVGSGSNPGKITLRLVRLTDDASRGMVIYEATTAYLSSQSWQSVTFKVNEFTSKLKSNDQVQLIILTEPGGSAVVSDIGLGGLYVYPKATHFSVGTTILSVSVVVGVIALAVLAAVLWSRKQRSAPAAIEEPDQAEA